MTKPKTPCYGCPDRTVGCHGRCEKYRVYREKLDGWNAETKTWHTDKPPFKYKKNVRHLS